MDGPIERALTFNLADMFEAVAGMTPNAVAMIAAGRRITYSELDSRANRLAHALASRGAGPGTHVGLQLLNGPEYIEGMLAAFKIRAVPINVNYRYVEAELQYLFADADLEILVAHRQFLPRIRSVTAGVPTLRHILLVEDPPGSPLPETADAAGSGPEEMAYEDALAEAADDRPAVERSGDDIYIAYTGGTTGMPKGVMWRHEDIFFAAMGGGDPLNPIERPEQILERPKGGITIVTTPPFMHVSAHWTAFLIFFGGGTVAVVEPGPYDPVKVWEMAERENANMIVVVGDAMARPLLDEYERKSAEGGYEVSSLIALASGGALISPATKKRCAEVLPQVALIDGYGSSETGVMGTGSGSGEGARFCVGDHTAVLGDDLRPVRPGSGEIGRLARKGHVPLGYWKDEKKSAAAMVDVDGERWVLPGDYATVAEDGTVELLGRGSLSINTGGEKVYPEEVEAAILHCPALVDALVVGVPDERWGQRVVAVVQTRPGQTVTLEDIRSAATGRLAGYKIPRDVVVVDRIVRGPNGKADYAAAVGAALDAMELRGRDSNPQPSG